MDEALEVPYILPDGRPLASLKQEEIQVFLYGFEAAEMQQVVMAARQVHNMIGQLVTNRGVVKAAARKAKIIPANASAEQREALTETLENMYANFNETGDLIEELKGVSFTKGKDGVKLPNILALSRKVQKLTG